MMSRITLLLALLWSVDGAAQTITTVAGGWPTTDTSQVFNALNVSIASPVAIAVSPMDGGQYFASSTYNAVFRIDPSFVPARITLVAGTGGSGFNGDGNPGPSTQLSSPGGLAFDSAGNLYIADSGNHAIRMLPYNSANNTFGNVVTLAGTGGKAGYAGDGSPVSATTTLLNNPTGLTFDGNGNLYVATPGTSWCGRFKTPAAPACLATSCPSLESTQPPATAVTTVRRPRHN
jgi:trimeric autotransporter adhesin